MLALRVDRRQERRQRLVKRRCNSVPSPDTGGRTVPCINLEGQTQTPIGEH